VSAGRAGKFKVEKGYGKGAVRRSSRFQEGRRSSWFLIVTIHDSRLTIHDDDGHA